MKELRKLNFEKLISVFTDVEAYSYDEYRKNGYEHKAINGYCVSCEKKEWNHAKDDDTYTLTNMSHGAHSSDFFRALKVPPNTKDWDTKPIMFVYETPSVDYGIYKDMCYDGYRKRPSKEWYWIHNDWDALTYPDGFGGRDYRLPWSVALTFKLANVYMTNLVKCGLNNEEGKFKGIDSFQYEAVENCFTNFLKKEICIINPKIIFAVGSNVEIWVNDLIERHYPDKSFFVQQLPHPAAPPFKQAHFRTIYFWHVVKALHHAKIINIDEVIGLYLDNL